MDVASFRRGGETEKCFQFHEKKIVMSSEKRSSSKSWRNVSRNVLELPSRVDKADP